MNDSQQIAYRTSDAGEINAAFAEANTVFMVIATVAGESQAELQDRYEKAEAVAIARNPNVWRVLWVEDSDNLDDSQDPDKMIKSICWGVDGVPANPRRETCIVVLSLGTGLDRVRKAQYPSQELSDELAIWGAFSKG